MATKPFVPESRDSTYREAPLPPARSWFGTRPGEVWSDPDAVHFGSVGPDSGYAGRLARLFDKRVDSGRLSREDAVAAGTAIAARRAALSGRAPIAEDLEVAFLLAGLLEGTPGDWSLVSSKIEAALGGSAAEPAKAEEVATELPEDWMRSKPREIRDRLGREGPEGVWADVGSR